MSLYTGVGQSNNTHEERAGAEACLNARTTLRTSTNIEPKLAIIFASSHYDQQTLLSTIRGTLPTSCLLIGSSTAGEITNEGSGHHSVTVMLMTADDGVQFFVGKGTDIKNVGPFTAGADFANNLLSQASAAETTLKSVVMFPDVLSGNGSDTVRGALSVLGENFPLVGGASGDNQEFKVTYQYIGDEVLSGTVVGFGLSGELAFGVGVRHGWVPIGMPMVVTKSTESTIEEIDGKPALNVYETYFGKKNSDLLKGSSSVASTKSVLTYPFGISEPGHEEILIRFATNVGENGSITCAAEIPEGSDIRLMIGSKERAIEAARTAASMAMSNLSGKKPSGAIIFNCIARNNLFGEEASHEIQAIQEVIGKETPLIGFYTYGEQAPVNGTTKNIEKCETSFHNETVVIYLFA